MFSHLTPYILGYLAFVEFYLAVRDAQFGVCLKWRTFFVLKIKAFLLKPLH